MQDSRIQSLAPKAVGAVNIEGLCIYGEGVLIGFRNPVTEYGALLIPLINPYELIFEGVKPSFGKSIRLDLVGLGIRSMDYHPGLKQYLIVAGPVGSEESPFKIFTWTGDIEDKAQFLCDLKDMKPESMVVYGSNLNVQILADSGSKLIGGLQCKDLAVDDERKHFDSIRLNLALK